MIFRKIRNITIIWILLLILTTSFVSALGEDATIHVTRLVGTFVGIKIEFASPISGSFAGVLNGRHFDCVTVGTSTLYCIGPFAHWVGSGTLHIYETPGGEIILTRAVSVPPKAGETEVTPPDPPPSEPELQ